MIKLKKKERIVRISKEMLNHLQKKIIIQSIRRTIHLKMIIISRIQTLHNNSADVIMKMIDLRKKETVAKITVGTHLQINQIRLTFKKAVIKYA